MTYLTEIIEMNNGVLTLNTRKDGVVQTHIVRESESLKSMYVALKDYFTSKGELMEQ